jgi:uncharacterized protein YegL
MTEGERTFQNQPEISEQIKRRAEAVALFMGGDYDMTVGVGPWGSGWHWDFVKNHVNMDAKDLATESEDVIRGVAAHEGGHKAVSRTESLMDLWQEPGFSFGFNAVEDPRANEGDIHFMPGSRKWIKAYIERDLAPGGGLDYQGIEKAAKDKMGYVPDFMKWGSDMIRYWHGKELSGEINSTESRKKFLAEIPDAGVRATVEKTLDGFEKYYKTLPDTRDEMEVRRKAREAGENFRDNIWPAYQKLMEKSLDDHSLVKMMEDMMEKDAQQGQGQGQGQQGQSSQPIEIPFSSLPKDVQDEIRKKVEEAQKEAKRQAGQKSQSGQGQQGGQEGDQGQENGEEQGGDSQQSQGKESESKSKEGSGKSGKGKIPWDKLSERAKKEAKKAFDGLSGEKQGEYKEAAKKDLEDAEDEANEKLRGKMNDPKGNETHKEKEEREEREIQRGEDSADIQQKMKDLDKKVEELMKDIQENAYNHFLKLPEVDTIRRQMERDFKRIFEPTESPDTRYTSTGLRPSMRKAMQMEADARKTNIFESKGRPTEKVFRFMFLIDLSGSMGGEKIIETFKALVPIIENLNHFGIEFEVLGYSDNLTGTVRIYKPFDLKKLDQDARDKLGKLLSDGRGGTPSMKATKIAYNKLLMRMSQVNVGRNYLISLTDGSPTDCETQDLAEYNNQIRKNKSIVTSGFGIGPESQYVNDSYPQMPNEVKIAVARKLGKSPDKVGNSFRSANEFGEVFAIIAGYMVKRPDLFS